MRRQILVLGLVLFICACTTASRINKIQIGMPRAEVVHILGDPVSMTATQEAEYLNYRLSETRGDVMAGTGTPYYIKIVDGKVEAFGRTEDLD